MSKHRSIKLVLGFLDCAFRGMLLVLLSLILVICLNTNFHLTNFLDQVELLHSSSDQSSFGPTASWYDEHPPRTETCGENIRQYY